MIRRLFAPLVLVLGTAGCSSVDVRYARIEDPEQNPDKGQIEIRALRSPKPERLADGYVFSIQHNTSFSKPFACSSSAPNVVDDLDAGLYEVTITGRHIDPIRREFQVRPGHKTDLVLRVKNARWSSTMENAAKGTGKVLFYTGLGIAYAVAGVAAVIFNSALDDDDEDCPRPPQKQASQLADRKAVYAGGVSKYRSKH